jgi:thiamine pyrophosphokinase
VKSTFQLSAIYWVEQASKAYSHPKWFIPEYIIGDFDSIDGDILSYYKDKGRSQIIHAPSEDNTDFGKSL